MLNIIDSAISKKNKMYETVVSCAFRDFRKVGQFLTKEASLLLESV